MNKWVSILLAGGQSRRMGRSKARLMLEGRTMIEHLVDVVQPFSSEIIIVANDLDELFLKNLFDSTSNVKVVRDDPRFQGEGPLAGMYTGMALVDSKWYFVGACDLAYLDFFYLKGLHSLSFSTATYEAYIPIARGRQEPLASVYSNHSKRIESLLLQGKRRISDLFQKVKTYSIHEQEWASWTHVEQPFFNMNTPEEYEEIVKRRG